MANEKKKCPLCNGCGKVEVPTGRKPVSEENEAYAKAMREAGYTIRKIAKTLGYKHPGSISHLLSK